MADVNYGGSTGYGRAYRKRLEGSWGIVDVDDCANAATHLAEQVQWSGVEAVFWWWWREVGEHCRRGRLRQRCWQSRYGRCERCVE